MSAENALSLTQRNDLRTVAAMTRGGDTGAALVAGNSGESLIVAKVIAVRAHPREIDGLCLASQLALPASARALD